VVRWGGEGKEGEGRGREGRGAGEKGRGRSSPNVRDALTPLEATGSRSIRIGPNDLE